MSAPGVEPPATAPSDPATSSPPRSRYSLGSNANMARSLLVILGMVAILVAIVPRVQRVEQPPVDATSVVADAVRQSGLPFEAPVDLPAGWSATSARYAPSTDGLPTWQAGWSTPKAGYVAIRQTQTASPAWIQGATSGGVQQGTVELAGRTWTKYYDSAHDRTSLVFVPSGAQAATQVATVVTAIAEDDELTTFTTALQPAQPR
jgi:Protein of unknown function (DUF4245)